MTDWLITEEEKNVLVRAIDKAVKETCPHRKLYFITIVGDRSPDDQKLDVLSNVHPNVMDEVISTIAGQTPAFENKIQDH